MHATDSAFNGPDYKGLLSTADKIFSYICPDEAYIQWTLHCQCAVVKDNRANVCLSITKSEEKSNFSWQWWQVLIQSHSRRWCYQCSKQQQGQMHGYLHSVFFLGGGCCYS